jgi:hypothetical protein
MGAVVHPEADGAARAARQRVNGTRDPREAPRAGARPPIRRRRSRATGSRRRRCSDPGLRAHDEAGVAQRHDERRPAGSVQRSCAIAPSLCASCDPLVERYAAPSGAGARASSHAPGAYHARPLTTATESTSQVAKDSPKTATAMRRALSLTHRSSSQAYSPASLERVIHGPHATDGQDACVSR